MRLCPQKSCRFPLLLCGTGFVLLLVSPWLLAKSGVTPIGEMLAVNKTFDTPGSTDNAQWGEAHWGDSQLACDVVTKWMAESPGTETITVSRREVAWVQSLTESAARQAKASHDTQKPLSQKTKHAAR